MPRGGWIVGANVHVLDYRPALSYASSDMSDFGGHGSAQARATGGRFYVAGITSLIISPVRFLGYNYYVRRLIQKGRSS